MALNDDKGAFYKETGQDLRDAFTSFNELAVANPYSLFDLKSSYGASSLRDKIITTGTGSVTNGGSLYTLDTGATGGSTAVLDSVERGRYIAGQEAIPSIAVLVPVAPTGSQVARWGYFNDNEGFGTGVDSEGFFTFVRLGGVERVHRRSSWYLPVNDVVALNKLVIYRYPFRWYGSGPVLFEAGNDINPLYPDLSRYDAFMASEGNPITNNPNLKIRAEVEGGGDFQIKVGGRQFSIQGSYNPLPRFTSESRFAQSVGTTFVPLISCKQTSGTLNEVSCRLEQVSLLVANASILWQIRLGSTVATPDAAPSNIPSGEYAMLYDNTATSMTNDGHKIYEKPASAGVGAASTTSPTDLPNIPLPEDTTITLCARSVSGTATVTSVFTIREEW